MTFLALLAALIAERYLLALEGWRAAPWLTGYFDWHQSLPVPPAWRSGMPGYLGLLLPLLILTAALEHLLAGRLAGLPDWAFNTLVLLYCLGPSALEPQVQALLVARRGGDFSTAAAMADALSIPEAQQGSDTRAPLCQGLLIQANRRVFAVLCWFTLLGPTGAVLYRCSRQIARLAREQSREALLPATDQALSLLDWLPTRITAIGYALAGCFEGTLGGWRGCQRHSANLTPEYLLGCAGLGSLGHGAPVDDEVDLEHALALYLRTLFLWVVALALITLPGWLS